jgi:hypothetical protein
MNTSNQCRSGCQEGRTQDQEWAGCIGCSSGEHHHLHVLPRAALADLLPTTTSSTLPSLLGCSITAWLHCYPLPWLTICCLLVLLSPTSHPLPLSYPPHPPPLHNTHPQTPTQRRGGRAS